MKNLFKILTISLLGNGVFAQVNSITTPTGQPLTIGNNGVKLANLTSASATSATNSKALSVDATGNIILVPDNNSGGTYPNPITTPAGTPLTIGNNGVRLANLNSSSATTATNGKALSVNATGDLILVPDVVGAGGGGDPNFKVVNTSNTLSGVGAGQLLQNAGAGALGTSNLFLGNNAGYNSGLTALSKENTFIGTNAGFNTTNGNNNAFLGIGAGVFNTTGSYNTYLGVNSGANNRTGSNNMALGLNAGYDGAGSVVKNNSYNVFIGNSAGAQTANDFNTFIGYAAGAHNVTGNSNIYIGGYAGGHSPVTTNSTCIFIGTQSGPWTGTDHANPTATFNNLTNATAIGNRAKVTISNALVLGGVDADAVKVGIGVHNPAHALDIKGNINFRLAMNSPGLKINDRDFLGIDSEGDFWVSNFKIKYQHESQWSDKVFEKDYKMLSINELENYITQNKHLPNIPPAKTVVEKGIDNAEITSKLLEKIEELSLYIIQLEKRMVKVENK